MLRFALRQFRTELLIGLALLALLGIILLITGPGLAHAYDACRALGSAVTQCTTAVTRNDPHLQTALPLIVIGAPLVCGVFFGAPLIARELETGTFRLAWTQSVPRLRWLLVKLAVVGGGAMALCGLLTWFVGLWARPLDLVNRNLFGPAEFGFHGVVPIGYAAFAVALGALVGALVRRTVAAMAITIPVYIAARLLVTYSVRPRLWPPVHQQLALSLQNGIGVQRTATGWSVTPSTRPVPNGMVVGSQVQNARGATPTSAIIQRLCPKLAATVQGPGSTVVRNGHRSVSVAPPTVQQHLNSCVATLATRYHIVLTYQPASRYWPFQWAEMGIFLAAAALLVGGCVLWIRRRGA